jgi:hypothetical protein
MSIKAWIQYHPAVTYFTLVLLISYGSFALVVGPTLLHGGTEQASQAEHVLFPILDLGVCLVGLVLTAVVDGRPGLRNLFLRLVRVRVDLRWYVVALLAPPLLVLVVLDPIHVSPAQETLWYWAYAAVLWIVVAGVIARYGKRLVRTSAGPWTEPIS